MVQVSRISFQLVMKTKLAKVYTANVTLYSTFQRTCLCQCLCDQSDDMKLPIFLLIRLSTYQEIMSYTVFLTVSSIILPKIGCEFWLSGLPILDE